jgi:transposase
MDQVHVIRHKVLAEGRSVRSVARQTGVSRNTVHKYLLVSAPARGAAGPGPPWSHTTSSASAGSAIFDLVQ